VETRAVRWWGWGWQDKAVGHVTPIRTLDVRPLPNESDGSDLKELILGSEGKLLAGSA